MALFSFGSWSIQDGFEKNNVIKNSGLVEAKGDGNGQVCGHLRGWGEGGGLADGNQGHFIAWLPISDGAQIAK
jgi:hypothetical protein